MGTAAVYGLPRWLCVQRMILTELERVVRDDGAVWRAVEPAL